MDITATARTTNVDDRLDIFGQQPGLKIYTQICLCFPLDDPSVHSSIIATLTNGLERLSASFPWVASQIVTEGSDEGNSGIVKFKPLEKIPRLVVKDLRSEPSVPTMDDLRRADFPFRMLDESIIAPCNTFPDSNDEAPVFLLQANFISGGLLLTVNGHHAAMDMTGQGQIMHLLSKACRGEAFTSEELSIGNLTRYGLVPLLDDLNEQNPEFADLIAKPPPTSPASTLAPPPKCSWAYFKFSPTSLSSLKSIAAEKDTLLPGTYVSTDDTLSAFIWQSITRARLPRLQSSAKTTFARAIDPRRYLNIPETYPGLVQNMTFHKYSLEKLIEEPLGSVASELRHAVDPKTSRLRYSTRALATLLHRAKDKSAVSVTANIDLGVDLMLSSWAKVDCYGLDFNLGLGKPEAVRRPQFTPVESLLYLMPKRPDGEIVAGLCLRDEDMDRLRADEEFVKYALYVG